MHKPPSRINSNKSVLSFLLSAVVILFNLSTTNAQVISDTVQANRHTSLGDSLLKTNNFEEASISLNKALRIYETQELLEKSASVYNKLSIVNWRISNLSKASEYAGKAFEISQDLPNPMTEVKAFSLSNLGIVNTIKGEFRQAIVQLNKALKIRLSVHGDSSTLVSDSYNELGSAYFGIGDYSMALKYFEQALFIRKDLLGLMNNDVLTLYNNLGVIHKINGNNQKSLSYHKRSLNARIELLGSSHSAVAMSYINIASLYYLFDRYQEAIGVLQKSIEINKAVFGEDHPLVGVAYINISQNYFKLDQGSLGVDYLMRGIATHKKAYGELHPHIARGFTSLGDYYIEEAEYDEALLNYKKALSIDQHIENHATIAGSYNDIGLVYRKTGAYEAALEGYLESLKSNTNDAGFRALVNNRLPDLSQISHPFHALESLKNRAEIFKLVFEGSSDIHILEEAFMSYQLCDSLLNKLRNTVTDKNDKLEFGKYAPQIYEGAIAVSLLQCKTTGNKEYLSNAFYFSEQAKSAALTAALADESAKVYSDIPDSLLALEKAIKLDQSYYQSILTEEKLKPDGYDTATVLKYESLLFDETERFDSLILMMERQYPEYYQLKYHHHVASAAEIQQKIPAGTLLLEYFQGDSLYLFSLSKTHLNVFTLTNDSLINEQVKALRRVMQHPDHTNQDQDYDQFISNSNSLYNSLLAPSLDSLSGSEKINRLIIIPDGNLSYIPFGTLIKPSKNPKNPEYHDLLYVIKEYDISYAHSASLSFNPIISNKKKSNRTSYLAFAPEYAASKPDSIQKVILGEFRDEIGPLKWNISEVGNISKHLEGKQYIGSNALESNFKSNLVDYNIIHLAMHALIDDEKPMNSKLVFTQNQDSTEDGFLYAHEIYNMEFNADLAILSACNTGFGKLAKGEGIMSLARAFSYAGCPSIVMSHWNVDDESTAQLMELFYKNLSNGLSKGSALQKAKLQYLETASPDKMHPRYWASFVVLGDTSPIIESSYSLWLWVSIIGALALVIGLFLRVYKRKKAH